MIDIVTKIQFISDIHLEMYDVNTFNPSLFIEPAAEYLALIGDIGYPEQEITFRFLDWCSKHWKKVFWVPGNHEYYTSHKQIFTVSQKVNIMQQLSNQFSNVILLNCTSYSIPHTPIEIVGCTLWSNIPQDKFDLAKKYMNDCHLIYLEPDKQASPYEVCIWHKKEVQWLRYKIQQAKEEGKQLIVLTHHLPTNQLVHPKYLNHPLNCCFATDLDSLIQEPIRAWLCGHSHTANQVSISGVQCALNPFGYPGEFGTSSSRKMTLTIFNDFNDVFLKNEDV